MREVHVRLRIGALALDLPGELRQEFGQEFLVGLTAAQTRRLLGDLEAALARRFEADGIPAHAAAGQALARLKVEWPPAGSRRRPLAERIAGAVYESLNDDGRPGSNVQHGRPQP